MEKMIKGNEKKAELRCIGGHFTDSCFPLANNGKVKKWTNEIMQYCSNGSEEKSRERDTEYKGERDTYTCRDTENPKKISIDLIYFS